MTPYARQRRSETAFLRAWLVGCGVTLAVVAFGWLWLLYVAAKAVRSAWEV